MDQPKKDKSKRPDTPLADSPTPDYSDMITTKRTWFKDKEYTPTAQDTAYYKQGFNMALKGKSVIPAYDMKTKQGMAGYYEAKKKK
tara:strand:+ start:1512 stop:1769 length:258 start_codon:yes stop_codon:yes gene_type:complete